jgi:protein with PEP-CTERM/exosortase system signal
MLFKGVIMKINGVLRGKLVLLLGIGCAVMLASGSNANANRISFPPSINLTIGDQHELGQVQPPTPEGDADITQYVNFMIGLSLGGSGHVTIGPHNILVTRSMNDFGSLPGPATLALRGTGKMINLGIQGTYDYLFAHYGGPGGGFAEVWYVGDLSGTISIPATGLGHGLSGWALFTAPSGAVPDGGTTVMLLGAGLGALAVVRRFLMG